MLDLDDYREAELGQKVDIKQIRLKPSPFGLKYSQTFKFYNGMGLILAENGILTFTHISWMQSLIEY